MALKVLELYSGIGGMHYAVKNTGIPLEVVAAVDINNIANAVYKHNFPQSNLMQRSIEGITIKEFDKLEADVLLMSPPCQPFTRVGLQADSADPRTRSFFHVLKLIQSSQNPPSFILVENVKGFENSDTRNHLVETLKACKYQFQEFLLSPNQFGIPNSRLRYFLLAKRHPHSFGFQVTEQVLEKLPQRCLDSRSGKSAPSVGKGEDEESLNLAAVADSLNALTVGECVCAPSVVETPKKVDTKAAHVCQRTDSHSESAETFTESVDNPENVPKCTEGTEKCPSEINTEQNQDVRPIAEFIEDGSEDFSEYMLSEKTLVRFGRLMDIVKPSTQRSCCFTKAYYHYAEGTGSVFQMNSNVDTAEVFKKFLLLPDDAEDKAGILPELQLRYFTPREVANLMCFPLEFSFPEATSLRQRYRLLGNSLNVLVVTVLLRDYLLESSCQRS